MTRLCSKCGGQLYQGNVQVVRRPGHRPRREHRDCETAKAINLLKKVFPPVKLSQARSEAIRSKISEAIQPNEAGKGKTNEAGMKLANYIVPGNGPQGPQDGQGGPITLDVVLDFPPPPRYRYFITPATAEKLKKAIEKGNLWDFAFATNWSMAVQVEIVPILEELVEANPEAAGQFIEVKIEWKGGS